MVRRPPRSTRTDTLFPYTTLFRSLSGGRMRLSIGVGWNPVEYAALGTDWHTRGARQAEQVTLLRRLWTEELVTFEGRWDRIEEAGLNPLPVQRPIPVWFGGSSDAVVKRAAKDRKSTRLNSSH